MLNAYLSTQTPSFRASMINNTVILAKKPPAKHTKCGSKSVIFYYPLPLSIPASFSLLLHFSDKRDGALYIYLHFYILPYLLVLFLAYHPYISFHF